MNIDKIKALQDELKKRIKTEGKAMLQTDFSDFFSANPKVKAIRWRQYTPYFNDGDPCVFNIYEPEFKIDGHVPDEEDEDLPEDGFADTWSLEGESKAVGFVAQNWFGIIRNNAVFLSVFGDDVQVTANREGFTVEEYDHN